MHAGVYRMFPGCLMVHWGHALALLDGGAGVTDGLDGFYLHKTRFLSRLALRVDGAAPARVSAVVVEPHAASAYALASASEAEAGPGEIAEKALELQLDVVVVAGADGTGALGVALTATNHGLAPLTREIALALAADFASEGEARGGVRQQQAPVETSWDAAGQRLTFTYGHARLPHATEIVAQGDATWREGQLVWTLTLPPQHPITVRLEVRPRFLGAPFRPAPPGAIAAAAEAWAATCARLETPNARVKAVWDQAVGDLGAMRLMSGPGPQVHVPAAGLPHYQALFGRDSLTAAWQAGMVHPDMLRGAIEAIGARLGSRVDDRFDEQPGRVIHQHQRDPLALLGLTPYGAYYGDYAGPGMFLVALGWHFALTGDRAFQRAQRGAADRVLAWMDRDGDRDGDGFYEYETRAGAWGTKNQGWKDSVEAILEADGTCVANPIAAAEIQGYYFAAKQVTGLVRLFLGDVASGLALLGEAQDLKRHFNAAFWLPEARCFALALGPDKRPVASVTSNAAQCLACGIVDHDKAAALAGRMMAPDMFSGWGVRTLSSAHPAYNPFAYHLGAVWPSENGSIALGFKRYGLSGLVADLAKGLFDAAAAFDGHRLPEAIGGHARDRRHPHPGIYPDACAPQAWSASAVVMLIQALTGILPLAPVGVLAIDPDLPDWLPELRLDDLPIGGARVSLRFRRDASGHTDWDARVSPGGPRVIRQAPPQSLHDGAFDRLGDLVASFLPV